jgi:CheY-like chemotaxis protein
VNTVELTFLVVGVPPAAATATGAPSELWAGLATHSSDRQSSLSKYRRCRQDQSMVLVDRRGGDGVTDGRTQPVVLVADDEDDILELIVFRLENSGYTVIGAHDGAEAFELARSNRPDLAVLDVMMPKMNGYELTQRLRADEATRQMPIILLTARTQESDVRRGFDAGADDYMRKPFSPEELRSRVQAILGRR